MNKFKLSVLFGSILLSSSAFAQNANTELSAPMPKGNINPEHVYLIDEEPNHIKVLETKDFRVFDVHFKPGQQSLWHKHFNDSVLVTIDGANVPSEEPNKPVTVRPPIASGLIYYKDYGSKEFTHRITNVDNKTFHILDIEIVKKNDGVALADLGGAWTKVLENDRVRVSKIVLQPGEKINANFKSTRLYIPLTDNAYSVAGGPKSNINRAFFVGSKAITRPEANIQEEEITNLFSSRLELVVLETK